MEIVYYIVIGVIVLAVLFGIKDWIYFIANSFSENGVRFTLLLIVLIALIVAPSIIKEFAPKLYGISIWALILYVVALLAYRFNSRKQEHKEG